MKKLFGSLLGVSLMIAGAITVQATSISIPFTSVIGGGVTYINNTSQNVVVAGNAFTTALPLYGLGTQEIGGDGINNPVSGNFGMVGAVVLDPSGDLAWAMSHPNEVVDFTIRLQDFTMIFGDNSTLTDRFKLEGLRSSFAQLATWGYTEVGPGIWMDVTLGTNNTMAISVVMNELLDPKYPSFNAILKPGPLGGPVPGYLVGSGITGQTVPDTASTLILLGFGLAGLAGFGRKLKGL